MFSMDANSNLDVTFQPQLSSVGLKKEFPVKVEYITDLYPCSVHTGNGSLDDYTGYTDFGFPNQSQYTPLLTPEQQKAKAQEANQLVPNLSDFELAPHNPDVMDDLHDQLIYNWTRDQVYSWLHQCMFELDDSSEIHLEDFNLTGHQLTQMTRDDFLRKAPKSGSILYNNLQSRLHIGAPIQLNVFNEDTSDGSQPSDSLLDIQDDKDLADLLFTNTDGSGNLFDFIMDNSVTDSDCLPPSPTSSHYTTDSDITSCPPSPHDATGYFAEIDAGVTRYRTNSAGEDTEDDSDVFCDSKSESSIEVPLVNIKIPCAPKPRGGKNLQKLKPNMKVKRPRGRPKKTIIKTESSSDEDDDDIFIHPSKGKGMKGNHLWEFIRDLLKSSHYNPDYIRWEDSSSGVFRIVHSEAVAKAWGKKKNNPRMTYEKLSRAMRYYYKRDILERVDGRRLVYKFGKKAYGWQESATTSSN